MIMRLTRYVRRRMDDGYFSSDLEPAVAGRFLLEAVTTFAMHRHADPDPQLLDDAAVRETVVRLIVRGLVEARKDT
jgi:hypothetical protein